MGAMKHCTIIAHITNFNRCLQFRKRPCWRAVGTCSCMQTFLSCSVFQKRYIKYSLVFSMFFCFSFFLLPAAYKTKKRSALLRILRILMNVTNFAILMNVSYCSLRGVLKRCILHWTIVLWQAKCISTKVLKRYKSRFMKMYYQYYRMWSEDLFLEMSSWTYVRKGHQQDKPLICRTLTQYGRFPTTMPGEHFTRW